jgi:hypothetical protein
MAFSPFHWFRKHQKVFFAGLTVLCMLVFIGQAGVGADIFHTILRWIGAGRYNRETLIVIDGKKVTDEDIDNVGRKRKMASDFLAQVAMQYHGRAVQELLKEKLPSDAPGNPLAGVRGVLASIEKFDFNIQQLERDLQFLKEIASRDKVKDAPDRLELLDNVATILGFRVWFVRRLSRQQQVEEFYFGGSRRPDDVLDFMVWQHQADKLGITLTDADLVKELKHEAAGQDVFNDKAKNLDKEKLVLDTIKNREYGSQTTPRDLIDALREEFRVVMAQDLLLGAEGGARNYRRFLGASSSPAVGTPDEFLRYYREQRTTLRVKMLTVPVSAFVSKVKAKPTEQELLSRYNQGREKEPAPYSREPGFKEPRRVLVEYVTASPEDPYYRDIGRTEAQAWKKYADPRTRAASTFGLLAGTAVAGPFAIPAIALDPYQDEYENYLKDQLSWINSEGDFQTAPRADRLHTSSVLQPANIAGMIGSLVASIQGSHNVFAAPGTLFASATFSEVRDSLKVNLAMLLARSNSPGSSFSDRGAYPQSPLTALMLTMPFLPKALSKETLEPQLMASLERRIAESTLQTNLGTLRAELTKLKGKDTETIRAYTEKAVKEHHLTRKAMPRPLPANVMIDELNRKVDLGIGPLEKAYLAQLPSLKVENFVADLFQSNGAYLPQQLSGRESDPRQFVYWRAEDKSARTRSFETVRAEVEAVWRFEEARKLARREAERLEAEINSKTSSPEDVERFLREQKNLGELFELNNVAQLVPPAREVHPLRATEYEPYRVPTSHINQLTYPPPDMVKYLLKMKRPGESTVIADMPAKNFYVAVLFDRDVPTVKQFEELYKKSPPEATLYKLFTESERDDYHKAVLRQLRADAGKLDKDGRFALPEAYRKRIEGGGREEE